MSSPVPDLLQVEEGFECGSCRRLFTTKYSGQRHIQVVHEGLRSFKCTCGKEFASRDQLKAHEHSKHLQTKPFQCKKGCTKSFASLSARHYHHKMIHCSKKFKCEFQDCSKEYSARKYLRIHVIRDHCAFFKTLDEQIQSKQLMLQNLQTEISQIVSLKKILVRSTIRSNKNDLSSRQDQ